MTDTNRIFHMDQPKNPQKPEDKDRNNDNDSSGGGETFGNEPEVQDPKKPRSPDKYEMNSF